MDEKSGIILKFNFELLATLLFYFTTFWEQNGNLVGVSPGPLTLDPNFFKCPWARYLDPNCP